MNADEMKASSPGEWKRLHALGLPSGSIRALLAILIFATIWGVLVLRPNQAVPDYLSDLLFIIMGHYFAVRRRVAAERDPGPPPLYLPNGTVRWIIVTGSVAVAVLLQRRGQLTTIDRNPAVVTLLLVGGFLLGVAMNAVGVWWVERGHKPPRIVEDLRALVSLGAAVLLILLVWNRLIAYVPPENVDHLLAPGRVGPFGPEHVLAAVVGFYFGSRS